MRKKSFIALLKKGMNKYLNKDIEFPINIDQGKLHGREEQRLES